MIAVSTAYTAFLEERLAEGEALVQAGRHEEAEGCAREVLSHQPRNPRAHAIAAVSLLARQRHADALAHVEAALRSDRVNPRLHFTAALCLGPLGRVEEAIASYRRALQYRPQFLEARANLGHALETAGCGAEAADAYRAVLAQRPDDWFCLNRLGHCERVAGRPAEAVRLLESSLAVRPDFAATCNELALAYLELGRSGDAVTMLRRAVELEPAFPGAWKNLAKLLYLDYGGEGARHGPDRASVLECLDRVLALDPADVEFAYLRSCIAGVRVDRAPDEYIIAFFDRFAASFEEKLLGKLGYRLPQEAAEFSKAWLEAHPAALRVVDLGCGTGLCGEFLRPAARALVGVDLSGEMLERARAKGVYDEVVRQEIVRYLVAQPADSLDFALALDLFIYVGDLAPALKAMSRALARDGKMVFSVEVATAPDVDYLLLPSGRFAHTTEYVEGAARDAGLEVARSKPVTIRHEAQEPVSGYLFEVGKVTR